MAAPARRVKVWDGWIRLVHWALAALLCLSWWAVETDRLRLHRLSGYTTLTLLLFRLAWGVVGSDTARFSRFLRSPLNALEHLRHLRRREADTEVGHNAAGGWMVLVLLGLLLTQAATGLFANEEPGTDYGEQGPLARHVGTATSAWLTGIHHQNFNLILAAVGLHILAVLAYRLLKGQDLVRPMLTGTKELPSGVAAPSMGPPLLAATLLGAAALIVWGISRLG